MIVGRWLECCGRNKEEKNDNPFRLKAGLRALSQAHLTVAAEGPALFHFFYVRQAPLAVLVSISIMKGRKSRGEGPTDQSASGES